MSYKRFVRVENEIQIWNSFPYLFFLSTVKVVDCRICGDPNSVLRFAFIEFTDEGNLDHITSFLVYNCEMVFGLVMHVKTF